MFSPSPATPPRARVVVHQLSGQRVELLAGTAKDLKLKISTEWGIPINFQRLVLDGAVLSDECSLIDYSEGAEMPAVTLVLELDHLYRRMDSGDIDEMCDALEELAQVPSALKSRVGVRQDVIARASALLDSEDPAFRDSDVVESAMTVFIKWSDMNDEGAIARVVAYFEDPRTDAERKAWAARDWLSVLTNGDKRALFLFDALASLRELLVDKEDSAILDQGMVKLLQVLCKGDEDAIVAVSKHLSDPNWDLRKWAMILLVQLVEQGDERIITPMCALLNTPGKTMCMLLALALLSGRDELAEYILKPDYQGLLSVDGLLEHDQNWYPDIYENNIFGGVMLSAMAALALRVRKGSERAIAAVIALLKDQHSDIRKLALQALVQLSHKGNVQAIASAGTLLNDPNAWVRYEAVVALSALAETGDECAICLACRSLLDPDAWVRYAAVGALSSLVEQQNRNAITALHACIHDSCDWVRYAAEKMVNTSAKCSEDAYTSTGCS